MTDNEINMTLALAIGWKPRKIGRGQIYGEPCVGINEQASGGANTDTFFDKRAGGWCVRFDYRDWNVIGPIATRYDVFPYQTFEQQWASNSSSAGPCWSTPQECIARTVIALAKDGSL